LSSIFKPFYQRLYTNETDTDITDVRLRFIFEDSLASGAGQTINISDLQFEIDLPEADYEDLTTWDVFNGIEETSMGDDSYEITHPDSNWPILNKIFPTIPADAQLKIKFSGQSSPGSARLNVCQWNLSVTGGSHIYLSDNGVDYQTLI